MTSPALGMPVRLGHLVPERRQIIVSRYNPLWLSFAEDDPRRDGTPELVDVILQAYVFGPRCPGVIKAELSSIEETYLRSVNAAQAVVAGADAGDQGAEASGTASFVVAWHTFLRETITTLIPGLTPAEADVLAADPPGQAGPGTDLLRTLGVWRGAGEEPDRPEAAGEERQPITEPSSPISSLSTASVPTSS